MSRKKTIRRCTECRRTGHDKRSCERVAQMRTPQPTLPHARQSGSVAVRVSQGEHMSAHVVDLRHPDHDKKINLPMFTEEKAQRPHVRVLDFGALVRSSHHTDEPVRLPRRPHVIRGFFSWIHDHMYALRQKRVFKRAKKVHVLPSQTHAVERLSVPFHFGKLKYRIAVLILIFIIPFPVIGYYEHVSQTAQVVADVSLQGFLSLQSSTVAAMSANVNQAQHDLEDALTSFGTATTLIERENHIIRYIASILPIVGTQIDARQNILQAGHHVALGNSYLIRGLTTAQQESQSGTDRLAELKHHVQSALPQYKQALVLATAVSPKALPTEYQQSFLDFQVLFAAFVDDLNDLTELMGMMETILGADDFKRYLVLFQNERELRATGGFIGSFAVCDVQKGKFLGCDIPAGGSYDLQGQLGTYVRPPVPLQLVNKRWEFQDANWWPDFPASAKKISSFYENSAQTTVDGVIAVNASVLESFLSVVGPIYNEEHDLALSRDTALDIIQTEVETAGETSNEPKRAIGSLAEQFLSVFQSLDAVQMVRLLSATHAALEHKDIQMFTRDVDVERHLSEFGWTGMIVQSAPPQDYLFVVGTNVGGAKSDKHIVQHIHHQVAVEQDGTMTVTLAIEREHAGDASEQFYGSTNIDYVRVFVPLGAELVDAGGFEFPPEEQFHVPESWYEEDPDIALYEQNEIIHAKSGTRVTEQFGKTVFGNWMITQPGGHSTAYVVYRLPFRLPTESVQTNAWKHALSSLQGTQAASRYSLFVQSQSGIESDFDSSVIYPDGWQPVWKSSDSVNLASNGAFFSVILNQDTVYGVVMRHPRP